MLKVISGIPKKILVVSIVALFLISMSLFISPSKIYAASEGGFNYTVISGNAQITGYTGAGGVVTIPDALGGYPVTSIGDKAFYGCSSLTSVSIPSGVTSIGDKAFYGCSSLTSVSIPSGVTSIGYYAFYGCSRLTSVSIPSGVTSISFGAFVNCAGLTSISIPSGVTSIGDYAFYGCSSLTSVSIPSGVTSIGYAAFAYCASLTTSISIPSGVTSIGDGAFYGCTGLASISFNSATTTIYYSADTIPAATKIIGYDPSTAKDYATTYRRTFEAIVAAEVAAGITTISAPSKDATSLTLPTVPAGFTVAIKSSGTLGVIALNGTIVPPVADTTVVLVLTVTKTSDSTTADTASINVVVPAKTVAAPPKPLTPEEKVSLDLSISEQVSLYGASNTGFTKMLYDNILGRVSDAEGLNDWVTALNDGKITLASVVYYFVFSKELEPIISVASPEEFITFLYKNVLDRNPDPQGLASWVDNMKNGMSKEDVLLHFIDSEEFKSICTMFGLTP